MGVVVGMDGQAIAGTPDEKQVPIDPKVLPELREADDAVVKARDEYKTVAYAFLMQTGMAAMAGADAAEKENAYKTVVIKVAGLHGIPIPAIKEIDTKKGVFILK